MKKPSDVLCLLRRLSGATVRVNGNFGRRLRRVFVVFCVSFLTIGCEFEAFIPTAPDAPDADLAGIVIECEPRSDGVTYMGSLPLYCFAKMAIYRNDRPSAFIPFGGVTFASLDPRVAMVVPTANGAWVKRVSNGEVEICGTFQDVTGGHRFAITERGCSGSTPGGYCPGQITMPCGTDYRSWPPPRAY